MIHVELEIIRSSFGRLLGLLFWVHVIVVAGVCLWLGHSLLFPVAASVFLALAYHLAWLKYGTAVETRYVSAVALMGQPALMVYLLQGQPWQMDMHMYFFAALALTIAWFDRRVILLAAVAVALHHLVLGQLLPMAVFPGGGDLARVGLHALIVAFQTAVLVWLSDLLVASFQHISQMNAEIVAKNIALEERTQEAESASRAKSMFLANMSHEIRTPMNAILGFCHLALRNNMPPQQRDYFTKINAAGTSLLRLINDILDFSKIEAGKLQLERRPFALHAAIDSQLNIAAVAATAKNVKLRSMIDRSVPEMLIGDELRFNQVVLNLVSNAVKFTEHGTVSVIARAIESDDRRVMLEICVEDSGIGMDEQQLASLFASFTQADSSTTRRFGGTGLGLAISKQLVELMGGTIHVESVVGSGSKFIFTVLMERGEAKGALPVQIEMAEIRKLHVLVADDNAASREILQKMFADWLVEVDLVASGAEALSAVESASAEGRPYDLVLLDWKMPGMDGIGTAAAMAASRNLARVPVILLVTAYGSPEFHEAAANENVAALLAKPVEPGLLLEAINRHVIGRNLEGAAPRDAGMLPNPSPDTQPDSVPMVSEERRGLTVLLVEDNDINMEIATELLRDAGLLVETAVNGRIACDRMAAEGDCFAAILMDVQMPEMDGIAATEQIRKSWSSQQIPIIAMTAHAYEAERNRCLAAGMDDHVAKPVDPLLLVRALDRWIAPRKAPPRPQPVQHVADMAVLPDRLLPFDIPAALNRVNGKRPLLKKMILSFGERYAEAVPSLREMLQDGRIEEANRLAHTLKGVAGSLELTMVSEISCRISSRLMAGEMADIEADLAELQAYMQPAIAAALSLQPTTATISAPDMVVVPAIEEIANLRGMLERRSLGARSCFRRMEAALAGQIEPANLDALNDAMERLDYGAALKLLDAAFGWQKDTERQTA